MTYGRTYSEQRFSPLRLRLALPGDTLFAGDPAPVIAPCSACHGPGGYKLGGPALQHQRTIYIGSQLLASLSMRQNDMRAGAHDREAIIDTGGDACSRRVLRRRPLACLEARAVHGGDGADHARGLVTSSGCCHSSAARSVFKCY